jgi:AcrR family transcriptional regulator
MATIEEALSHAIDIMTEEGVGGLSISEMARRMGIRPPSLYKYFPSLHAVYDELFARGYRSQVAAARAAMDAAAAGLERLVTGSEAIVRWCADNPALAQLMFWRPVPGFVPSAEAFAASVGAIELARDEFAEAIQHGYLNPDTDLDELVTLFTVVISGIVSQQLSNEPGVSFENGRFSSRTERAVEILFAAYRSGRKQ